MTCFHGNKAKKKRQLKKKKNGRLKKTTFFKIANSQYFFVKILWISRWVSRIDWCEGHWCGSTYMICFRTYVGQPDDQIGWATSMPLASICPTHPRTNPWNFREKILRIGGIEKLIFFESAILNFFLLHPHENQSIFIG